MFILRFIAEKYVMIMEMVGLGLVLFASVHLPKRMLKWTLASVMMLFLSAILIRVELWTQTFETLSGWRPALTCIIYLLHPAVMIALTQTIAQIGRAHV